MADRSRRRPSARISPYQPPSLQHRASQTVIDLTGDSDEPPSPPPPTRSAAFQRRPQRLPRLGRDDILGADEPDNLIDLTADNDNQSEADLELIEVLQRRPVIPAAHNPPRAVIRPRGLDLRRPANLAAPPQRQAHAHRDFFLAHGPNDPHRPAQSNIARLSHHIQRAVMAAIPVNHAGFLGLLSAREGQGPADLDIALDYDAIAFGEPAGPPAEPQKTPHVPPEPAREGFTRTPAELKEDEILICPACDEELVQHHNEEPQAKTNAKGKALTDKERAEHPFWVVRKCGHVSYQANLLFSQRCTNIPLQVFCNKCYQERKNKTGDSKFFLPGRPKTEKTLVCPVEDCTSTVSKPTDWIGMLI